MEVYWQERAEKIQHSRSVVSTWTAECVSAAQLLSMLLVATATSVQNCMETNKSCMVEMGITG